MPIYASQSAAFGNEIEASSYEPSQYSTDNRLNARPVIPYVHRSLAFEYQI